MINFHTEVIKHMLEVVDARKMSALLGQSSHWTEFNVWCRESSDATYVMKKSSEEIETVCLNPEENLYCVAMSMQTLEGLVKELVETYEDRELERFLV